MSDFMNQMRDAHDWLINCNRANDAKKTQLLFEFRKSASGAASRILLDPENIEELFSLASATSKLTIDVESAIALTLEYANHKYDKSPKQVSIRIQNKERLLNSRLSNLPFEDNGTGAFHSTVTYYQYALLALLGFLNTQDKAASQKTTLISFNYDTVIEDASVPLGFTIDYCLGGDGVSYQCGNLTSVNSDQSIRLLKLHGSVNWARAKGKGTKFTVYRDFKQLHEQGRSPELIPPTWRKIFNGRLNDV